MLSQISGVNEMGRLPIPEILWYSCDGMMVIDEYLRILAMNPAMERLTGYPREQVVGKSECSVLLACRDMHGCPLADRPGMCPGIRAIQTFKPVPRAEYTIRRADAKEVAISASYTPIQLPGHPIWALVVVRDITAQKRRERNLTHQAISDPLTGLPNRTLFLETLLKEIKRASRHNRFLGLAMIDIDGFKDYNDAFGHLAGDELLRALAGLLNAGRRTSDLVARYGGDEFVLLLPETDAAGAMVVAERLVHTIAHFPFGKPITISMGMAIFPEDGKRLEDLLERADGRLYGAKRLGHNRVIGPD